MIQNEHIRVYEAYQSGYAQGMWAGLILSSIVTGGILLLATMAYHLRGRWK